MITLNVIYTPDSALLLAPFAATLLRWSDCRVRLVANGCSAEECAHLAALAAQQPRPTFLALPTATTWPHSAVLDWLHDGCEERFFAFVDSDLFAVGPFLPADLSADLTCLLPPTVYWDAADERWQPHRHRMGCTYFAIYDSAQLHAVRRRWGVGFAKQRWERLTGD